MVRQGVLIIDPQEDRRRRLAGWLAELNYGVLEAGDGGEGLKIIEAEEPVLVFCDREIAGHSARELCEYVQEFVEGRVSFVLMVAENTMDPEKARNEVGANGVLRHPVAWYELINLGEHLLAVQELQQRLDHLMEENAQLRRDLREKTLIDPITRFYRFEAFKQLIVLEVKRAKRYGFPLSILLMAFDNFQHVSGWLTPAQRKNLYTHARREISASIRDIDIPLLFAEEKVLIVMPHTGLEGAARVADRIRDRISAIEPPGSLARLKMSCSISVACTESAAVRSFGTMIKEAMRGLKEAEIKGGDVVLVCRGPDEGGEYPEVDGKLGPRTFFV